MGTVYRAVQRSLEKSVAVKILKPRGGPDSDSIDRFVAEAKAIARMRHPNIVGIQGLGRLPDGNYFLVMDLVEGGRPRSAVEGRPSGRTRGGRDRRPGGGRPGACASAGDRPPRPEAEQRPDRRRWSCDGRRFRVGQEVRRGPRPDRPELRRRNAPLHGPGAGGRPMGIGRPSDRHPRTRCAALRRCSRAVRPTKARCDRGHDPRGFARASAADRPSRRARGDGRDRRPLPEQAARRSFRIGGRGRGSPPARRAPEHPIVFRESPM